MKYGFRPIFPAVSSRKCSPVGAKQPSQTQRRLLGREYELGMRLAAARWSGSCAASTRQAGWDYRLVPGSARPAALLPLNAAALACMVPAAPYSQ